MGATGPKLSLLNMLISSLQFVRTVGATNHPLLNSLRRSPPVTASAPSLSALLRTFSYRSLLRINFHHNYSPNVVIGILMLEAFIISFLSTLVSSILLYILLNVLQPCDHVVCLNGHVCCSGTPTDVAKSDHYRELFGEKSSQLLSLYEHNHDHIHSTDGNIVKEIK